MGHGQGQTRFIDQALQGMSLLPSGHEWGAGRCRSLGWTPVHPNRHQAHNESFHMDQNFSRDMDVYVIQRHLVGLRFLTFNQG
jgi:hypothetical protein